MQRERERVRLMNEGLGGEERGMWGSCKVREVQREGMMEGSMLVQRKKNEHILSSYFLP